MHISPLSVFRSSRLGFSPWMLAGVACILLVAMMGLSERSNERERAFMVRNLTDRAEALIWALEAGTRTGMRHAGLVLGLVPLLTETARQPGIVYMAVADTEGRILALSGTARDDRQEGVMLPEVAGEDLELPLFSQVTDKPSWRMRRHADGSTVFEVYRTFAPLRRPYGQHGMSGRHGMGMHGMEMAQSGMSCMPGSTGGVVPAGAARPVVGVALVAFDAGPYEDALKRDVRNNLLWAALAAVLALAGVVSLSWVQHYRRWRRMLRTEVTRLRAEVARNERLAALGHLAAGVAHEIRNPLSTIKGVALYIAQRVPAGGREETAAKRMIDEVERLDRVVSSLLDFARPDDFTTAPACVGELIGTALRLAEADVQAKNIKVICDVPENFPQVCVNGERLTQALLNLVLNAVQAMEQGGTLRVRVRLTAEDMFSLEVSDNGPGIAPEARAAIFTPYFTTKPSGTGLGLAIVHRIAEGHGGSVRADNAPAGGAVFTLTLPVRGPVSKKARG